MASSARRVGTSRRGGDGRVLLQLARPALGRGCQFCSTGNRGDVCAQHNWSQSVSKGKCVRRPLAGRSAGGSGCRADFIMNPWAVVGALSLFMVGCACVYYVLVVVAALRFRATPAPPLDFLP